MARSSQSVVFTRYSLAPSGYSGSQGVTGYSGSQGGLGYTGGLGTSGYTGSQGTTGYTGSTINTIPSNSQTSSYQLVASEAEAHFNLIKGNITVEFDSTSVESIQASFEELNLKSGPSDMTSN